MAFPKISEVRDLDDTELAKAIADAKKQLFDLRLKQATQQLEKTHEFKHLRHRIAQLLTVERERQLAATPDSAAPATSEPASPEVTPSEEE